MGKVSVVVPFYRGNQYIPKIVRMAWENAQNINKIGYDLELIIVNDSPEYEVELGNIPKKLNLKVINHQENMGIHQARVTGIQQSDGEYILMLDQDDEIKDDYVIKQLRKIGTADVVVSNAIIETSDGAYRPLYSNRHSFEKIFCLDTYIMSHNQIVSPGQCLIKKASIPKEWFEFIMATNGSDDLFLWVLMLSQNMSFVMNEDEIYIHKYTGDNLSISVQKMTDSSLSIVQYFRQIKYVSPKMIDKFERARLFDFEFYNCRNIARKLSLLLCNIDILLFRVIWKVRCVL